MEVRQSCLDVVLTSSEVPTPPLLGARSAALFLGCPKNTTQFHSWSVVRRIIGAQMQLVDVQIGRSSVDRILDPYVPA